MSSESTPPNEEGVSFEKPENPWAVQPPAPATSPDPADVSPAPVQPVSAPVGPPAPPTVQPGPPQFAKPSQPHWPQPEPVPAVNPGPWNSPPATPPMQGPPVLGQPAGAPPSQVYSTSPSGYQMSPPPVATPQHGQQPPAPPVGFQQAPPTNSFVLASWGSRLAAYLLDGFIVLFLAIVPMALPMVLFTESQTTFDENYLTVTEQVPTDAGMIAGFVFAFAAIILYYGLTMGRKGAHNGQTYGKQILNIRVVRDNGQAMNFGAAAVREFVVKYLLFGLAGQLLCGIPTLLNYLWPLWDDETQALHDKMVATHVVNTQPRQPQSTQFRR